MEIEGKSADAEVAAKYFSEDGEECKRTGTLWTCIAHIVTALIGAGVLSLPWSVAQLGWIGGPLVMVIFAFITYISVHLLSDCYRSPDSVTGKRNRTYMDAVRVNLGKNQIWACGLLQYLYMYGIAVAYVLTSAGSMRAIRKSNCFHSNGHNADCQFGNTFYMILFGVIQILCSLIPDFNNMSWLSAVAAIMSVFYSTIGLGLGIARVVDNKRIYGNIRGVQTATTAQKVWRVSQAIGDIAFSFPYSFILLEIQDTLRSKPPENLIVKRASIVSISITALFYLSCACFGYAAFGDDAPGNILTGFGFYEPYWLIDFGNACIVLHLVGGYQVFSQPVFAFFEGLIEKVFPKSMTFLKKNYSICLPCLPVYHFNLIRLVFRTLYVVSTVALAMYFPYFNQVLGILGALNFWPLAIYFPIEMYMGQKRVRSWSTKWVAFEVFSIFCLLISLFALIGSVEGLVRAKLGWAS
ncbi:amino acid permease 3-like isoform X2 [Nymphaea colorata]|nr:amino acid permease 3-like isoform X2 [Nymphaea colorata]